VYDRPPKVRQCPGSGADPVDRARLPIADPAFTGVANRTLEGSRPDWGLIGHIAPPEGAPNVLLVLIDDAGFGQPSAFGGPIAAPSMTVSVTRVCVLTGSM